MKNNSEVIGTDEKNVDELRRQKGQWMEAVEYFACVDDVNF